jgi:capsular exopolysaccharide synthesis family protein
MMAIYAYMKTPVYEGVARLQIDPMRSSSLGLEDPDKSVSPDIDGRIKTEVEIIRSNTVAAQVMMALGLYANPHFVGSLPMSAEIKEFSALPAGVRRSLLNQFSRNLTVRVVPNTQIVEIRFRGSAPDIAADTTNSIIDAYMQRNFQTRVDGTAQVSQWLSKQMEEIKASTAISQHNLAEFQEKHNLLGSNESDNIVTDRLKQLNEELTQAEAERIVKEERYRAAVLGDPELISSTPPSATLQVLRNQQADLESQYALLSAKFGKGYPKLRELQAQLSGLAASIEAERANIKARLAGEYHGAAKTEAMIRVDFAKQKAEAYNLNEHASQYASLKHEVESGQHLYDTLQFKVKEAAVTTGLTSSYVNVIDRAQLPEAPVEPRKTFYLALGLGGGLFGALMLSLVLDSFDETVKTAVGLEAMLGLPELGSVPYLEGQSGKGRRCLQRVTPQGLITKFDAISITEPNSLGAEAYRSLCSILLLSSKRNPPRVLAVTSAMSGEGKSTVSCNLATALAQRGKRILLVDADMRCSSIHPQLRTQPPRDHKFANVPDLQAPYQPFSKLPNLIVVPAGFAAAGPLEILASSRMQDRIAKWRREYDHVIIDTPPLFPFADTLVISSMADAVILVARSEVSRCKALVRAQEVLGRTGTKIVGFVLNAVKRQESYFDYPAVYKQQFTNRSVNQEEKKVANWGPL